MIARPPSCPRCELLEEQVAFLRRELGISDDELLEQRLRAAFGLALAPARVLALLHRRGERPTSWELVDEALPSRIDERSAPRQFAGVMIHALRRALGSASIENLFGVGWRLAPAARPIVARVAEEGDLAGQRRAS